MQALQSIRLSAGCWNHRCNIPTPLRPSVSAEDTGDFCASPQSRLCLGPRISLHGTKTYVFPCNFYTSILVLTLETTRTR